MHLRGSKGSFYGERSLTRREAIELHMQNSAAGLPFESDKSVKSAGEIVPHQLIHGCCICGGRVA